MKPSGFSFILYQKNASPRYYEISHSKWRLYTLVLPLITFLSVVGLVAFSVYFKQIRDFAKRKEPAIITDLREEVSSLTKEKEKLQKENEEFLSKLGDSTSAGAGLATLQLFKSSLGRVDLSNQPKLQIEEANFQRGLDSIKIDFSIVNITPGEEKVAGYIFVILQQGGSLSVYPRESVPKDEMQLSYNKGEYFAVTRFRPVSASFSLPKNDVNRTEINALVKVLIFSRTGDLLGKRIFSKTLFKDG